MREGIGQGASDWWNFKWMTALLFSCEHATCAVPEAYREIFRGAEEVVESAEGWEAGALNLGQAFAMGFRTPLVHGDVTRLLIDLEKDGDARWSRFSMKLSETARGKVADRHERPFRTMLRQRILEDLRRHEALLHVMIHTDAETFGRVTLETPEGGALAEEFAAAWRARLMTEDLDVRCHRNAESQALGQVLSEEFPADRYARIRLSVSQSFFLDGQPWRWDTLKKLLVQSLSEVVAEVRAVSDRAGSSTGQG